MITVEFKRLVPEAELPKPAHSNSVGYDVKSVSCEYDIEHDMYIYHTGLACQTQSGVYDLVTSAYGYVRSSNRKTDAYLCNHVGIVDSDEYRGEIVFSFKNRTSLETMIKIETLQRMMAQLWSAKLIDTNPDGMLPGNISMIMMENQVREEYVERAMNLEFAPYEVGDRVGQFVFACEERAEIIEVDQLDMDTERGEGGHGSTGA